MARPTATAYLMKNLNDRSDFTASWSKGGLTEQDKNDLRQWAEAEMDERAKTEPEFKR